MAQQGDHGISWTDETWNPIRGCTRVSAGCQNCYAERVAARFSGSYQPYEGLAKMVHLPIAKGSYSEARWTGEVRFIEERLADPLRWQRPRRVFVNSMSDLFHEKVQDEWIDRIFAVMALCPRHTFQILTKRPERMLEKVSRNSHMAALGKAWTMLGSSKMKKYEHHGVTERQWPMPNVWLGVSVEDQKTTDERIPLLLQTPAAVHWVSYEPALGPVNFAQFLFREVRTDKSTAPRLDWLVCGGESGPGARPMHPDWARSARDQCKTAGVAFHFKQFGEYLPPAQFAPISWEQQMKRVGKRAAGRILDGRTWDEYPEVGK